MSKSRLCLCLYVCGSAVVVSLPYYSDDSMSGKQLE
jgi:hypothetical protein